MSTIRSGWIDYPEYQIQIVQLDNPISIVIDGEKIVESKHVLLLSEQDHSPVYYFPEKDVRMSLLSKTTKLTFCPFKGEAEHWALLLQNSEITDAAWCYQNPFTQVSEIKNYLAFYPEVTKHIVL